MSGYNAYGHEQIGTWFQRNIRQQVCTGDHFHWPPPPPPPPPPERKEAARRLFPDRRPAQLSPKLVFHLPSTRHMTPEHHVPRPNRRLSQTVGTARRKSSPENLPRPPNIPQPNIHLKISRPTSLQSYTSPVQLRALRWSVTKLSSWQKPLLPTSNTQWNSSTSYQLVRCFFFVFAAKLGKYFVLSSYPERLHVDTFSNSLLHRRSLLALPGRYVLGVAGARSVELVAHWPSARTKEKKGGKSDKRTNRESTHFTQFRTSQASSSGINAYAAGFLRRQARWLQRVSQRPQSRSSNIRISSLVRNLDTDWALRIPSERMLENERSSLYASAWLAFI